MIKNVNLNYIKCQEKEKKQMFFGRENQQSVTKRFKQQNWFFKVQKIQNAVTKKKKKKKINKKKKLFHNN